MDDGGDAVALRGGGDGRDDSVGGHAKGGLAVENGWRGEVLSGLERGVSPGAVSSPYMVAATRLGFRAPSFANWLWAL